MYCNQDLLRQELGQEFTPHWMLAYMDWKFRPAWYRKVVAFLISVSCVHGNITGQYGFPCLPCNPENCSHSAEYISLLKGIRSYNLILKTKQNKTRQQHHQGLTGLRVSVVTEAESDSVCKQLSLCLPMVIMKNQVGIRGEGHLPLPPPSFFQKWTCSEKLPSKACVSNLCGCVVVV